MKRLILTCLLAFCAIAQREPAAASATGSDLATVAENRWANEIAALESRDQHESHPPDSILFVGSSSIRLWETIATDMAPYRPIQRGYGGARFSDLSVFAERLIAPHQFRALVLFVANDVSGGTDDATPEQVAEWFTQIIEVARETQPAAPIFCLEITPSQSRWQAWPRIREVNRTLARVSAALPNVHFIPTAHAYLGPEGEPHEDLFLEDRLHLNSLGYRIWAAIIKSHLDAVFTQSSFEKQKSRSTIE
jgi:hypothetical protein